MIATHTGCLKQFVARRPKPFVVLQNGWLLFYTLAAAPDESV